MRKIALTILFVLAGCGAPELPGASTKLAESPTFGEPTSTGKEAQNTNATSVKLKFRAAVIRGSGDILPVARQDFIIRPYSETSIKAALELKNNPGDKPELPNMPLYSNYLNTQGQPNMSDEKYKIRECLGGNYCYDSTDFDAYRRDSDAFRDRQTQIYNADLAEYRKALEEHPDRLKAWQEKAWAGLEETIQIASNGLPTKTIKTNLSGEADVTLTEGLWYFTGRYSISGGDSSIFWIDVPIKITADATDVELSNDNGEVINL